MNKASQPEQHYDQTYFEWQSEIGQFGAKANSSKFSAHISSTDAVLDFGCGGGFLLAALKTREKLGVEVNQSARDQCRKLGIDAVSSLGEVSDNWADVAISHHALEHVSDPLSTLRALRDKIKSGGKIVCVVPCESFRVKYAHPNQDNHLYTWSPMNLGNLIRSAGFDVVEVKRIAHRWPPKPLAVQKLLGWPLFHLASKITAHLRPDLTQIICVARKH